MRILQIDSDPARPRHVAVDVIVNATLIVAVHVHLNATVGRDRLRGRSSS